DKALDVFHQHAPRVRFRRDAEQLREELSLRDLRSLATARVGKRLTRHAAADERIAPPRMILRDVRRLARTHVDPMDLRGHRIKLDAEHVESRLFQSQREAAGPRAYFEHLHAREGLEEPRGRASL